jgi:fumarylacetoacetate (FAA) hydrolase
LQGACDAGKFADEASGIDFEAGLAVTTGDVPAGASPEQALDGVRLMALTNSWTLRGRMAQELAQGLGPVQSKPAVAFSPVAVTPDELGDAWREGHVNLTLQTAWNGRTVGLCEAGEGQGLGFGELVAYLAATRRVGAGTIVGSGPVSNSVPEKGYNCIAEKRAMEALLDGQPATAFMKFGDTVRIEMKGKDGQSLFGAIEQKVTPRAA